ncbi:hypothetical protein C8R43DRAFT_1156753 [Mycena crocata]|nr:hypothetical protein C8R43DRAFT_1156753 [Mycena crocata]
MHVVFTRFGTLFRIVFSSLRSHIRFLFSSREDGVQEDIEGGITPSPKVADLDGAYISPSAHYSRDISSLIESPTFIPMSRLRPPRISGHLYHGPRQTADIPSSAMPQALDNGAPIRVKNTNPGTTRVALQPLGNITNTYSQPFTGRPRAQTLKRVPACPDLRSQSWSRLVAPGNTSAPGSMGWQSDKMKLLDEARAWSTRVKRDSDARRQSLPLPLRSESELLSKTRRASAPANLGGTRLTLEERLNRVVSGSPTPNAVPVPPEPKFNIGEDDAEYFDGDTFVLESIPTKSTISIPKSPEKSELPYLHACSPSPSSESISSGESDGTLSDVIDALEAMFTTTKWLSLVDLGGAAKREEARLRAMGRSVSIV